MRASAGKRILMLLENNPYPEDGRVRREATSLTRAGYQVTVIAPGTPDQPRTAVVDGVKVYRYPAPKERDGFLGYLLEYGYSMIASSLITLYVSLRSGFDVIHAHNPPDTFVLIAVWYKIFGKRFVFDHHDLSPEMYEARFKGRSNALIHRLLLALEKLTFRMADHVVATNESYRQVALERGDKRAQDVTVVRNGPDTGRVRRVEPDLALQARADHIIVYVGVMGFQDGVDYLIRSLNRLVVDLGREDFLCVIVGSGVAVPSLKELAAQLNLDDQVWFTGRISDEDLMRYLSTADICVDPDPFNPFNDRSTMIKMTEYMAMGKPIVAFDLTEHRHTAQEAALYAAANDEMDFAKKLVELMDDPQQRRQMGDFGRSRIDRELAWPHQAERLIAAYDRLTARAGVDDG